MNLQSYRYGDACLGELPLEIGKLREVSHQVPHRRLRRRSHRGRRSRRPRRGVRRTPEANFLMHFALGNLLSSEVDQRRSYLL